MKTLFISFLTFCTILFFAHFVDAQDQPKSRSRNDIQTVFGSGQRTHHGFFIAPSLKLIQFDDKTAFFTGLRGGWIINRTVAIGFEGNGLIPTITKEVLSPAINARPLSGYGGFFIEPIIGSNKIVHLTTPILFGAGWAGYVEDWNNYPDGDEDLIDDQIYWVIEPGANIELNVATFFRLGAGVSYRFTQDLELVNTPKNALQGLNFNFMMKFGRF